MDVDLNSAYLIIMFIFIFLTRNENSFVLSIQNNFFIQ